MNLETYGLSLVLIVLGTVLLCFGMRNFLHYFGSLDDKQYGQKRIIDLSHDIMIAITGIALLMAGIVIYVVIDLIK